MSQANIINKTAFAHEVLFVTDENGRPVITPIIKGTFDIQANGQVKFANPQIAINLDGKYIEKPQTSSYLYEPESAFIKNNTDVVVHGYAVSSNGPVYETLVDIHIGMLNKKLLVIGDRYWVKQGKKHIVSNPLKFEKIPLLYENAFGGWDRRHKDCKYHGYEPRNTVGKGFYNIELSAQDKFPLPNIENPVNLITHIQDRPEPTGCGFTLPHWEPRKTLAGTYDQQWQNTRSPLLPKDFSREFFNAASQGLISNGYLHGNEVVEIKNMTPEGKLLFNLPGIKPPICEIETKSGYIDLTTNLDTIIINTQSRQVNLIWRNYHLLATSHHDIEKITINYG